MPERGEDALVAGLDNQHAARLVAFYGELEFVRKGRRGRAELAVIDGPAGGAEVVAEVAHGAEEQGGAGLVAGNVRGLLVDFGHDDDGVPGIRGGKHGGVPVELIAEDEEEVGRGHQ